MRDEKDNSKRAFTLYLDKKIINYLEDEKWKTHKSPSYIINEILKKRYKLNQKGGI